MKVPTDHRNLTLQLQLQLDPWIQFSSPHSVVFLHAISPFTTLILITTKLISMRRLQNTKFGNLLPGKLVIKGHELHAVLATMLNKFTASVFSRPGLSLLIALSTKQHLPSGTDWLIDIHSLVYCVYALTTTCLLLSITFGVNHVTVHAHYSPFT